MLYHRVILIDFKVTFNVFYKLPDGAKCFRYNFKHYRTKLQIKELKKTFNACVRYHLGQNAQYNHKISPTKLQRLEFKVTFNVCVSYEKAEYFEHNSNIFLTKLNKKNLLKTNISKIIMAISSQLLQQ